MTNPVAGPGQKITVRSVFNPARHVELDPYGPNPLAEDMKGGGAYAAAVQHEPPPKMFQGGRADLPAFTASGIDPKQLLQLPYNQRHAMAAESDPAVVHANFEQNAHNPDAVLPHEGLDEAKRRMSVWASTAGINPVEDRQKAAEDMADSRRAADLANLSPERRAAIAAAAAKQGT